MKKKILGLALVAMSFVTVNSIAQTPNQNNTCPVNKENAICKKGNANRVCNQKQVCPFDGLNLSDAQKDQMKQLKAKRDAARAEMKKADKADKQRRDSAKMADRRNAKKEYLEEIKVILTPEQYTMFLENFYINGGNHHAKAFNKTNPNSVHKYDGESHALGLAIFMSLFQNPCLITHLQRML